jgi:hypothetical protein
MTRFAASFASLIALTFALPAAALPVHTMIDDFSTGDFVLVDSGDIATPTLAEQSGLSTSNVIGGVRLTSARAPGVATTATASVSGGALTLSTDSAFMSSFNLYYDAIADGSPNLIPPGVLGADFTGATGIELDLSVAGPGVTLQVYLYESFNPANPAGQVNFNFFPIEISSGKTYLDFALFPNLDANDIQTIRLLFSNVTETSTVTINQIAAVVPEPGTGLLLTMGLLGMGARRKIRS